jgi:hypothetical protein
VNLCLYLAHLPAIGIQVMTSLMSSMGWKGLLAPPSSVPTENRSRSLGGSGLPILLGCFGHDLKADVSL